MPTTPELMGTVAQALQDASGAQQQLLEHLPTLMERADQLEAEVLVLRRLLRTHHGCGLPRASLGDHRVCLTCGADFDLDSVHELQAKLALRPAPAGNAPQRSVTVLGEQADVVIPMDARWRPGKPDDWADVEPTDPKGAA